MQNDKTHNYRIIALTLAALWLAMWVTACAPGAPMPVPADVPSSSPKTVPLTPDTVPLEPTAAPPPSKVPPIAAAGAPEAAAEELRAALAAMEALEVFQAEYHVVLAQSAADAGSPISKGTALVRNGDAYLTLARNASEVQVIAYGGKIYQRDESVNPNWMPLTEQEAASFVPKEHMIAPLRQAIGDPTTWQALGTETLDGAECALYLRDRYATADLFFTEFMNEKNPTRDYVDEQLERAETRAWICPDGYLRQTQMVIEYKPAVRPFLLTVTSRVFDVHGDFSISAPTFDPKAPQGDATQAVQAAVKKTKTLDSYRFEISAVSDDKQVLSAKGAAAGANKSYVLQESESGSLHESEVLVYEGKIYMRPAGTQDAWQAADSMTDVDYAASTISSFDQLLPDAEPAFIGSNLPFAWKQKETLDGMECDVYIQTQRVEIGANYELTVCPDGYWHRGQFTLSMEAGDMSRMLSLTTTTRLTDLNAPITIEAPK